MKKKLTALMIAICLLISFMPTSVFAESSYLRVRTASSDSSLYPNYQFDNTAEGLPANSEWTKKRTSLWNYFYVGGSYDVATYCIQMDISDISTEVFYSHNDAPKTNLTDDQLYMLSVALCMGHTSGNGNSAFQAATQIVVWMITTGAYTNEGYVNAILNGYIKDSSVKSYANQLWNDCQIYYTVPSFCSEAEDANIPVYDMVWDNENQCYSITLVDENDALERFSVETVLPSGYSYNINGNKLTITSEIKPDADFEIELLNTTAKCQNRAQLMYMYRSGYQEMAYRYIDRKDPVPGYFKLAAPQTTLTINKRSTDGCISDMKFKITSLDDETLDAIYLTTDENGNTETVPITPGRWHAEETDTPSRYVQPKAQDFTVTEGQPVTLTFENKARVLQLTKVSVNGVVENLEFRVVCKELNFDKTVKTDKDGKWEIVGVEPGIYEIEELNVPDNFFKPEKITVEVTADKEVTSVTCENLYKASIFKYDVIDGEGVEGATIKITDVDTEDEYVTKTDGDGYAYAPVRPGHSYEYVETIAVDGYELNTETYHFSVSDDGLMEGDVDMLEIRIGTAVIRKVEYHEGTPIEGALIQFYDAEMNELEALRTDEDGFVYFWPGEPGVYFYREIEPPPQGGYYLDEDLYEIEIDEEGNISGALTFKEAMFGTVIIRKTNEAGEYLKGAEIGIYDAETDKELLVESTDDMGRIYFDGEAGKRYYAIELKAPDGYVKDTAKHYFELTEDYEITGETTIINAKDPGPKTGTESYAKFFVMLSVYAIMMAALAVYAKQKKLNHR